ncbi:uncharacterized protein LOC115735457 isoform X1 [Rhodamnia argentea]|uniref:Uncharacterized protein LOC115735457 isoform X1 n=1 Tax=Rhodamnia argentea TaxID=178133 RepID=A0ABM3HRJ2_9MYRT|nr:uncharacterized protein LOC115735457 isoform X1 [Rhodamnia argentea]
MNSSKLGDGGSGYPSSADISSNFHFCTPSVPGSGSVFTKSRISKRRSINRLNLNQESRAGPGANPFLFNPRDSALGSFPNTANAPPASDYVFSANRSDSDGSLGIGVVKEMQNLRIGSGNESVTARSGVSDANSSSRFEPKSGNNKSFSLDESVASALPEGMRKLNIQASDNKPSSRTGSFKSNLSTNEQVKVGVGVDAGTDGSAGKNVEAVLLDQLKKKLNIREANQLDGNGVVDEADKLNESTRGSRKEYNGVFAGNSAAALPDQMTNLNLRDPATMDNSTGENDFELNTKKTGFVFGGSTSATGRTRGVTETVLVNEINEKLNIGSKMNDCIVEPVSREFSFQSGMEVKHAFGSQVPLNRPTEDIGVSGTATSSYEFPSRSMPLKGGKNVSSRDERNINIHSKSKQDDTGPSFMQFKTPVAKVDLASGFTEKIAFTAKREAFDSSKLKKKKGKLRQSAHVQPRLMQSFVSMESVSLEKPEASEPYSPMDVSPYQETLADNPCSRDTSVTSNESYSLDNADASDAPHSTFSNDAIDESLLSAAQRMDINDYEPSREATEDAPKHGLEKSVNTEGSTEEPASGAETESFKTAADDVELVRDDDAVTSSGRTGACCSLKIERSDDERRKEHGLASHVQEMGDANFTFTTSSASYGQFSAPKHKHKKKAWVKSVHDSHNLSSSLEIPYASSSIQPFPSSAISLHLSPQPEKGNLPSSQYKVGKDYGVDKGLDGKLDSTSTSATTITQEACEKWRLRGNQAYASGDAGKAEEYYTHGINCVSDEMSRSCLRALMLCYSNRAATRMALGRMRDAIGDCMMAIAIDPNFFRVQVRAANCYLALGEVDDALRYYKRCLQLGNEVCADRKITVEASEGLQKAQKVSECMNHAAMLLLTRASKDVEAAVEVIAEALVMSSYSEKLLEMKAEALFMLRRYEEVIQLSEQTLDSAKKNSLDINDLLADQDGLEYSNRIYFRIWRCRLMFKSYFQLGRLEEGLASLERQEELISATNRNRNSSLASLIPLVGTARELIRLKAAGNEAFQAGRHAEAVEHYTAALSCNVESRPFAAICFCNRAAAFKAMGQITDAIADCSLAIALDGNYLKGISRRATLFEMIRDYGQAAADLRRLVSILTKQVEEKTNQVGVYDMSLSSVNELKQASLQLSELEEAARTDIPLDIYLILGVEPSASLPDIRKAYRKAALKHHPDKACQFLAKCDNGDDNLWKGIAEEVRKDADRLFKMIGEAHAILSEPTKRLQYDLEEERRNTEKKRNGASTTRTHRDDQNHPLERSGSRQQRRESWRTYGSTQSRASESNRWTRYT